MTQLTEQINLQKNDDVERSINIDIFNDVDNIQISWQGILICLMNSCIFILIWMKSSPASNYTKPLVSKSTILARHNV